MFRKDKYLRFFGLQCHISFENTDQQTNNLKYHKNFLNLVFLRAAGLLIRIHRPWFQEL